MFSRSWYTESSIGGGVIPGFAEVFRNLPPRRASGRETPENLDSPAGGPNGICHLVGQYLRFPLKGTALRT